MEIYVVPKSIGTKRKGSAGMNARSKASSIKPIKPAKPKPVTVPVGLCLKNRASIDLDFGKLYRILPDRRSRSLGYVRVIDESGEDYLYPDSYFRIMRLDAKVAKQLVQLS